MRKNSANGHDLLLAFEDTIVEHYERALTRSASVNSRIVELEDELSALRTLSGKLDAVVAVPA